MRKDKRRSLRRPIRYTAWVLDGPGASQGCVLSDISDTGARIDINDPKNVPDRFLLWLSANGSARRTCRVVWRKPRQIGVIFEPRLIDSDRTSLVPTLAADGDAQAAPTDASNSGVAAHATATEYNRIVPA